MTDSMAGIAQQTGGDNSDIRPFYVNVPEAELTELRRRTNSTSCPDRETVTDESQGVPLATIQELARYWATDYDWRKCDAKLNALPQFITEIDGLDIHAGNSHQLPWDYSIRHCEGAPVWRSSVIRPIRRRKTCLQAADRSLYEETCLRTNDGDSPANAVRITRKRCCICCEAALAS